jgi:hypothetical protein
MVTVLQSLRIGYKGLGAQVLALYALECYIFLNHVAGRSEGSPFRTRLHHLPIRADNWTGMPVARVVINQS